MPQIPIAVPWAKPDDAEHDDIRVATARWKLGQYDRFLLTSVVEADNIGGYIPLDPVGTTLAEVNEGDEFRFVIENGGRVCEAVAAYINAQPQETEPEEPISQPPDEILEEAEAASDET